MDTDEYASSVFDFDGAAGSGPLVLNFSSITPARLLQEQQEVESQFQSSQEQNLEDSHIFQQDAQQLQIPSSDTAIQSIGSKALNNQGDMKSFNFNGLFGPISSSENNFAGASDVEVSDAMSAFGFNAIIFIILIGVYELLSRIIPSVYAARRVRNDPMIVKISRSILPLSWLPVVVSTSWATVRKHGGLDAYFYLRFIRLCVRITSISGLWGMIVLWPVFASGGDHTSGWYHFSMANLSQGSGRIWFPTIFMWFMTFYVLFAINEEYKHYLELRIQYLAEGDKGKNPQTQHSLLIEAIPRELRSDTALYGYFDSLFPGKVHSAYSVLNIPDLEKISAKRKRAVRRLEKSIAHFEATGARVTHIVGRKRLRCFGVETYPVRNFGGRVMGEEDDSRSPQRGERVDSLTYYTSQLVALNETMDKMQAEKKNLAADGNAATPWISQMIDNASVAATSRLVSVSDIKIPYVKLHRMLITYTHASIFLHSVFV